MPKEPPTMHDDSIEPWRHSHDFSGDSAAAEKSTGKVMWITAVTMVAEIAAGMAFGSMALLADGWHMATHVAAFGIALFAYRYARHHADNPRYTFGTGKVSVLGGFASAIALAVVALLMAMESVVRMLEPHAIRYNEAIGVAILGLVVNLICGWMLHDHQERGKARPHGHRHHHHGEGDAGHHLKDGHQRDGGHEGHASHASHASHHSDPNIRGAYLHVVADALTSVFAIIALLAGKYFGWVWLDPLMGIVGAALITRWSIGLTRDTGQILLDGGVDERTRGAIRKAIEEDADNRIADLHVWYVGPRHYSASVSLVTYLPRAPEHYKGLLRDIPDLAHVLIEVNARGAPTRAD